MTTLADRVESESCEEPPELPVVVHARVVRGAGGGPEKTILNSPRYLARHGYRGVCAYMHPPGDPGIETLRKRAGRLEAPLWEFADRGIWDLRVVSRLLRKCRQQRVAIWHGHDYKSNAIGLLLRRFWPMKLVTTVHGWVHYTKRSPLYYTVDRFCLKYYERVLCVSEDLLERCAAAGVRREALTLVPNAIDTVRYRPTTSGAAAKERIGAARNRVLIGAVGRLAAEKGFDTLILAVDRLLTEGHSVDLWIAGEGKDRARLERLIVERSQPERFRLLGYRGNVRELLEAMDVFALSSLREGLPNVLLEAMAMEVPVVATSVAGVPRLVRDGTTGLLVEPQSIDELADALRRLVEEAPLRERLAAYARRVVEEEFSFERRMEDVAGIYDAVLDRNSQQEQA